LTPAIHSALVQAARRGIPPSTAARAIGISDRTVREWLLASKGTWSDGSTVESATLTLLAALTGDIAAAQASFEAEAVESILEAGKMMGKSGTRDWRATAWALNNLPSTRATYREHRELKVEHAGQVSHEHRVVRELEDGQLLELLPPELADIVDHGMA
jgi:hypothetical protein